MKAIIILSAIFIYGCHTQKRATRQKQFDNAIFMVGTGPLLTDSLMKEFNKSGSPLRSAFIRNDTLYYFGEQK